MSRILTQPTSERIDNILWTEAFGELSACISSDVLGMYVAMKICILVILRYVNKDL